MNAPQDITEAQFFEMVDRFISQANQFGAQFPQARISAALLFAAARYNAFNWVNRSQLPEQTLDEAAILFRTEYETMFRDNVGSLAGMRPNA
jgi:hypothetical protein